jgi:hypothetical protein
MSEGIFHALHIKNVNTKLTLSTEIVEKSEIIYYPDINNWFMFANYTVSAMIRAGVLGSGEVLENALEIIRNHSGFLITGYNNSVQKNLKHGVIHQFNDPDELISVSEALVITNNPGDFNEVIPKVLKNSKHLLIFPDFSLSFYLLENLLKLADEAGVVFYIHQDGIKDWMKELVHRYCGKPEFIDVYSYINRHFASSEAGIFDALYKAISAVIRLNPVNPGKFYTNLVPYYSPDPLMTNVRIVFENGTSANITVNGFFERNDSKIEIFSNDCEAIIDPCAAEVRIISKNPNSTNIFNTPANKQSNLFREGLDRFAMRLFSPSANIDPFESGIIAHKTATSIIHKFIPYPVSSL